MKAFTVLLIGVVVAVASGVRGGKADPYTLDCPVLPPAPRAASVHDLRPSDIRVVAALGDSISAGFAMDATNWIVDGLVEYRGNVFSVGGNADRATVPNFLKTVSGNMPLGASMGDSSPLDAIIFRNHSITANNPSVCHLNAAQSNALAQHMVETQVDYLVDNMKKLPVDMENDWKMVTILIGANNICPSCQQPMPEYSTVYDFGYAVNETISMIKEQIPRTFINLVYHLPYEHHCPIVWDILGECPCMRESDATRAFMDELVPKYNEAMEEIASYWNDRDDDQSAVVIQPYLRDMVIPDEGFVSKLDCFHPSASAEQLLAIGLWNNLFAPKAEKKTSIHLHEKPVCPTSVDRIRTD